MTDKPSPLDELPEGLRDLVAGIVDDPVPNELTERVRDRLRESQPHKVSHSTRRPLIATVVIASAIGVAIAVIVLVSRTQHSPRSPHSPTLPSVDKSIAETDPAESVPDGRSISGPSLWAYHRAAADSFETFDSLLTQHATSVLPTAVTPSMAPRSFQLFEEDF